MEESMKKSLFTLILSCTLLFACGGNSTPSSNNSKNDNTSINSSIDLSTLEKIYHNLNSYDNLELELENILLIDELSIDGITINSDDYRINNRNNLIIRNNVFKTLKYGSHLLSINNEFHYNLEIYDDRTPSVTGDTLFKYLGNTHPYFQFILYGGNITSISYNEKEYPEYIKKIDDGKLTIDATFCEMVLSSGYNDITVTINQYHPDGVKSTYIVVQIYKPKTGNIVPGTPVPSSESIPSEEITSKEEISDYVTPSEGVSLDSYYNQHD